MVHLNDICTAIANQQIEQEHLDDLFHFAINEAIKTSDVLIFLTEEIVTYEEKWDVLFLSSLGRLTLGWVDLLNQLLWTSSWAATYPRLDTY